MEEEDSSDLSDDSEDDGDQRNRLNSPKCLFATAQALLLYVALIFDNHRRSLLQQNQHRQDEARNRP
jgi:hypothetical protein